MHTDSPESSPANGPSIALALAVLNHTSAMMGYWDTQLVCRFSNRAYSEWFGKSMEQMRGIHMSDALGVVFTQNRPYIQATLAGETQVFERSVTVPNGSVRHTVMRYTPDIVEGRVQGFFAFVIDVSALKTVELELKAVNAELVATQLLLSDSVRDAERARIARDLHDAIGHHLTALNLHLELARRHAAGKSSESLDISREIARRLLDQTREIVGIERNRQVVHLGQALQLLCQGIPSPKLVLRCEGIERGLSHALAHTAFCCVQEAITNVVRHAQATEVVIEVLADLDQLCISVTDDGHGIGAAPAGNGLRGMRERVAQHAGECSVRPGKHGGTCVRVVLPREQEFL